MNPLNWKWTPSEPKGVHRKIPIPIWYPNYRDLPEKVQHEKVLAMKNKDVIRKNALNAMIDACQKASITPKGRIEITEDLVNEVLIKYQKTQILKLIIFNLMLSLLKMVLRYQQILQMK